MDQKNFQLHRFLNIFLQLAAEKKYSINGASGKFFGPSYFVTTLEHFIAHRRSEQFAIYLPLLLHLDIHSFHKKVGKLSPENLSHNNLHHQNHKLGC